MLLPLGDHLPTRTVPFVNYAIIAANIVVFVLQLQGTVDDGLAFRPRRLFVDPGGAAITVLTSMFMHEGVAHIAGNMLYLWIFGDNVEDAMGHARYLVFYVLGGVCALAAQTAIDPTTSIPMLGASGAISAVLAAYAFLYPRSPVTVLNPFWPLWFFWGLLLTSPAWLVIGFFFVMNLWYALTQSTHGGGVAFMAHVGGFVGGAVLFRLFTVHDYRLEDYARHERWLRPRDERRASRW